MEDYKKRLEGHLEITSSGISEIEFLKRVAQQLLEKSLK